jgi:ribosomal protein S18 acetylase RimI-like enzyme
MTHSSLTAPGALALPAPWRLRTAVGADQNFFDALFRANRDDLVQAAPTESFLVELLRMQQKAQENGMHQAFPKAQSLVLERDGAPVGRVLVEADRGRVHLIDLALLPAARGQGGGSALLRALQAFAAGRAEPLTLSVSTGNHHARRLYLRLGFVPTHGDEMQENMRWEAERNG